MSEHNFFSSSTILYEKVFLSNKSSQYDGAKKRKKANGLSSGLWHLNLWMVVVGCWNRYHQYGGLGEVCWMRLDWLLRVGVGETKMS